MLGWAVILGMVYLVSITEVSAPQTAIFDPYALLDLPTSASEKEIKSQYRQFTLKFHPDKVHDLEGNMTKEDVEARFVDITKAYKALTDPEVRENYAKYGHPDGPQETSHGIALPKFLVDSTGSPIVIALYSLFFALVLPYLVGKWWATTQMYTKSGIHRDTAGVFFETLIKEQAQFITHKRILELLSDAEEYKILLPKSTPAQVLELLEEHLSRKSPKDLSDDTSRLVVVARAPTILDGYLDIAGGFKNIQLCQRILDIRRAIVQSIPLNDDFLGAEVLQVPGTTPEAVYASGINNLAQLTKLESAEKVKKAIGADSLEVAEDALESVKHIPKLHVLDITFQTPGEDVVPPKARVFVIVRYVISAPGVKLPKFPVAEISDDEAISLIKNPKSGNNKGPKFPQIDAPYFPVVEHPSWDLFVMGGQGGNTIIEGPLEITNGYVTKAADVEKFNTRMEELTKTQGEKSLTTDSDKKDEKTTADDIYYDNYDELSKLVRINTLKFAFPSPSPDAIGSYPIVFSLLSKDYFGLDSTLEVPLVVEQPKEDNTPVGDDVYDIPEPEEDSIAGAMAQMQGRTVTAKDDKVKKSSKDDSDEEIEEEDLSDIDSDTDAEFSSDEEDEDEKKKK